MCKPLPSRTQRGQGGHGPLHNESQVVQNWYEFGGFYAYENDKLYPEHIKGTLDPNVIVLGLTRN